MTTFKFINKKNYSGKQQQVQTANYNMGFSLIENNNSTILVSYTKCQNVTNWKGKPQAKIKLYICSNHKSSINFV